MSFLVLFFATTTLVGFDDVMDLDDMAIEVPNTLGSKGCQEQSQVDYHDNGFAILEESQLAIEVCIVEVVKDNPIVRNDPNMIITTPPIPRSGVQEVPQALKGHTEDFLPNSSARVSSVILLAQPINVKSTKQKGLDDVVNTSPPRKNASICGCVAIPTKKKQDSVANKKRKKTSDDNFNVTSKLATYVA